MDRLLRVLLLFIVFVSPTHFARAAEFLKVKDGREAILKTAPTGNASQLPQRLPAGTIVEKLGQAALYFSVRAPGGVVAWSYKGNFEAAAEPASAAPTNAPVAVTKESLLARTDVLKIIVLDVEVGDSTLIICPAESERQDVILIDTGENDSDRIKKELIDNGFIISTKPINRFIVTHYDGDHMGHAREIVPLAQIVFDHGNNNIDGWYRTLVSAPGVDRRTMTLAYDEDFSGSVKCECVAVNQATDADPHLPASIGDDNPNSIALIVSFHGFDYFTGGDLTFVPERSLAAGIRNCDVYHANHHGSRATSSDPGFVTKLDPEVSVASNGTRHGHPSWEVAQRLIALGSQFYQTNVNPDTRAHHPDPKYVGDDTYLGSSSLENAEGATGTIRIIVDPVAEKYYVLMEGLPLSEATFPIEK